MTNRPRLGILKVKRKEEGLSMMQKSRATTDAFKYVFWARTALIVALVAGVLILALQ